MTFTITRILLPACLTLGLTLPAMADFMAQGTLLPKKETHGISFVPKNVSGMYVLDVLPQGAVVKKGESVIIADFREVDAVLEDFQRLVKARKLNVMRLRFDLEQQKLLSAQKVKESESSLLRSQEDQKDFLEKRKARMLSEEEERVNKSLRQLSYKQEELNQLVKMYRDDQVAEDTEEIILKRLKNEVDESEFAVQGAKLIAELSKLRTINRMVEDYQTAVDQKELSLRSVKAGAEFDIDQKKLALTDAEVSLKRTQNKYNDLMADRSMGEFKAPADGIFIYGGYVGDKWMTTSIASKLCPGGKLEPHNKIGTIVPPNSELIVQAILPDSAPTPRVGDAVIVKITNKQVPGTVSLASPIPDSDGKRRILVTPEVPAADIFAPGLPVQVTIKDKQL
ncbi:MAG: hypothetical protein RSD44_02325 [Akkermansia sp.]